MFKVCILIALAIAGANAQAGGESASAPEPYSYGYETESHSASEQRDASGKVTGYYTIVDVDGRQRRVDYIADESGFRAKVQTNEVGTKSDSPADVEVVASPPNAQQYAAYTQESSYAQQAGGAVQQAGAFQQARGASGAVSSQFTAAQPARATYQSTYQTAQQPGYAYGQGYYGQAGYGASGSQQQYVAGQAAAAPVGYRSATYTSGVGGGAQQAKQYSSYNNHLPSQYYKSVSVTGAQPAAYSAGGVSQYATVPATAGGYSSSRYVSSQTSVPVSNQGAYRYVQTVSGAAPVQYAAGPVQYAAAGPVSGGGSSSSSYRSSYSSGTVPVGPYSTVGGPTAGSSNYIVL